VHSWCESDAGREELADALRTAAEAYIRFLTSRPTFVRLVIREDLGGGLRMRSRTASSMAMHDAFGAIRRQGARRGIRRFDVGDAILVFVGMTFAPITLQNTLMRSVRRDLSKPAARRRQAELAVAQLMPLISG
jgi:hypothetical protein